MKASDLKDHLIDLAALVSITVLMALRVPGFDATLYLVVIGPLLGAKAAARAQRPSGDGPSSGGTASGVTILLLALGSIFRHRAPLAGVAAFVAAGAIAAGMVVSGCGLLNPPESPHVTECNRRYDKCAADWPKGPPENEVAFQDCMARVDADCLPAERR